MTNIQLNLIQNIYNTVKNYCKCIYIAGSKASSYINNPEDTDVVIVCNDTNDKIKTLKLLHTTCKETKTTLKDNYNIVIIVSTVEKELQCREYCYQDYIMLFGDTTFQPFHDILNNVEDYKAALRELHDRICEAPNKKLYRLLTGIYILQNNSYQLTQEQIANINLCHDMADTDRMAELLEYCREYLFDEGSV